MSFILAVSINFDFICIIKKSFKTSIIARLTSRRLYLGINVVIVGITSLTQLGSRDSSTILALHRLLLHPASPRHNEHHTTMTYDCN